MLSVLDIYLKKLTTSPIPHGCNDTKVDLWQ